MLLCLSKGGEKEKTKWCRHYKCKRLLLFVNDYLRGKAINPFYGIKESELKLNVCMHRRPALKDSLAMI